MKFFQFFALFTFFSFALAQAHPFESQEQVDGVVVGTALRTYRKINENWTFIESEGRRPQTESPYWSIQDFRSPETEQDSFFFVWKKTRGRISEALDDIVERGTCGECMTAAKIVRVHCLKELLGVERFEQLVDVISTKYEPKSLLHILSWGFLERATDEGPHVVGPTAIVNIPEYSHKINDPRRKQRGISEEPQLMIII